MFAAHHLHPEFGLFCASPSLRRKLRVVLASFFFLTIVGALALTNGRDPSIDIALPLALGDGTHTIQTDGRATTISTNRVGVADTINPVPEVVDEPGLAAQVRETAGPILVLAETPTLQAPPKNARKPTRVQHNDYERSRRYDRWSDLGYAWRDDRRIGGAAYAFSGYPYPRRRYERSWGGFW